MNYNRIFCHVILISLVIVLTACASGDAEIAASPTPPIVTSTTTPDEIGSSPSPTSTHTPDFPTPSQTTTATQTATPPQNVTPSLTPVFPGSDADQIPLDDFFLAGFTDECEFPCWYGLQIDESGPEDVQRLFDDVFGFDGNVDFWAPHEGPALTDAVFFSAFPGLTSTGYVWHDHSTFEHVGIVVYMSESTGRYQGLAVVWGGGPTTIFDDFVLSDIFQKLGTPSNILISIATINHWGSMLIVYDQGFVFHIPVTTNQSSEDTPRILCLGDTNYHEYSFLPGTMVITSPLNDRLDDLSEFETAYFGRFIWQNRLQPLDEVSDTTVDQFVQAILNGEDACIEVSIVE